MHISTENQGSACVSKICRTSPFVVVPFVFSSLDMHCAVLHNLDWLFRLQQNSTLICPFKSIELELKEMNGISRY